jgi:hypothetical protein
MSILQNIYKLFISVNIILYEYYTLQEKKEKEIKKSERI